MTTTSSRQPSSDERLRTTLLIQAADLVLAMVANVARDNKINQWSWAEKGLQVAAGRARDWPRFISEFKGQLKIEGNLRTATANSVSAIGRSIEAQDAYATFRAICRRDAVYIVLEAQVRADEMRVKYPAEEATIDPQETTP